MLIGLALRHGVPVYLNLPAAFYTVLSNGSFCESYVGRAKMNGIVECKASVAALPMDQDKEMQQLMQDALFALAMAVRMGLVAAFPEVGACCNINIYLVHCWSDLTVYFLDVAQSIY